MTERILTPDKLTIVQPAARSFYVFTSHGIPEAVSKSEQGLLASEERDTGWPCLQYSTNSCVVNNTEVTLT